MLCRSFDTNIILQAYETDCKDSVHEILEVNITPLASNALYYSMGPAP